MQLHGVPRSAARSSVIFHGSDLRRRMWFSIMVSSRPRRGLESGVQIAIEKAG
jgi:hypothetical protein